MRVAIGVLLLLAANAHADPEKQARALLEAQLATVNDPAALAATLAPEALIFGNGSFALARGPHAADVVATLGRSPAGLPVVESGIASLDAGGDDHAMWLIADVTLYRRRVGRLPSRGTQARIVELVAADRVVAFGFATSENASAPGDVLGNPGSGRLLSFALAPWRDHDVRVVGFLETRTAAWGLVAADLIVDDRSVRSLVLAIPAERGEWTVVAKLER